MCVRKVKETIKDSVFAELKKRIREWELDAYFHITNSPMVITNKLSWCQFIFRWIDDPEKVKSVEWVERIWIEEATELSRVDFDQLDLRLRGKPEMQITCTFNPTDAEHFLNTDFWVKWNTENQVCIHTTYKDNRFVWPEYEIVMERLKETNPNYYNIYALWHWWVLEWVIFENWNTIPDVPEEAELICYGLDFWFTNDPSALVWVYKWNNSLILDELIYDRWLTNTYRRERKFVLREWAKNEHDWEWVETPISSDEKESSIVWRFEALGISQYVDIYADSSEPKSIEEIYREWYNIKPVEKGPDSVRNGIDKMKQYPIYVTARSWNLRKEKSKYVWNKDKNGKPTNTPIDAMNHAIDASRYAIMMWVQWWNDFTFTVW